MSEKRTKKKPTPRVVTIKLNDSLDDLTSMQAELDEMKDVLLGRSDPPINKGELTLMEVAEAYFARASEIEMYIKRGEASGVVPKGSMLYKFRTGELRTFQEICKASMELGSRRITYQKLLFDQELGRF